MAHRLHIGIFLVSLSVSCSLQAQSVRKPIRATMGITATVVPVPIIFDTDMGPDYDDVGAITILHALADSGQAQILATIASTNYPRVAPVLSVLNTYFGRPTIPIGVPKGKAVADADRQHWSDTLVANYPHSLQSNTDAADAVTLYRQVLARQPDKSVTIVTVGFLTNLANLLTSSADTYSPLAGSALVAQKVNQLVCMAGWFPQGREFNVFMDTPASLAVFGQWPTPILMSGFEIGQKVKSGLPLVKNAAIQHSPVKDVFRISIPLDPADANGRMSWDQTAVLVAIKGPAPYYSTQSGRLTLKPDGSNGWDTTGTGHAILVPQWPIAQTEAYINKLMQHQPVKSTR